MPLRAHQQNLLVIVSTAFHTNSPTLHFHSSSEAPHHSVYDWLLPALIFFPPPARGFRIEIASPPCGKVSTAPCNQRVQYPIFHTAKGPMRGFTYSSAADGHGLENY